jgi:hypothetical protein
LLDFLFFSSFVVHDIFFLDCFCARIFFWLLPNPPLKYLMVRPLLPLCYDREIKDLTFFYKALYGYIDVNVNKYIAFIGHGRTRHSQIPLVMKAPRCKTNTFQASFYNRIVKLWNTICKSAPVHGFSNISSFKQLLKQTYLTLFNASFDVDFPCTWTLSRDCSCHWELALHTV